MTRLRPRLGRYTDHKGVWQIQDLWCEADWWRRNHSGFCAMDINACYADLDRCREIYPAGALGGTVEIDFLCGTDPVCGTELTPAKFERAKANLRDNYAWVGILENMPDSLRLLQAGGAALAPAPRFGPAPPPGPAPSPLPAPYPAPSRSTRAQTLLPEMFGGMNASAWAERHIAPDGGNPTTSPMPSDQTLTVRPPGHCDRGPPAPASPTAPPCRPSLPGGSPGPRRSHPAWSVWHPRADSCASPPRAPNR